MIEFSDVSNVFEYILTNYDFISYQLVYIEVKSLESKDDLEKSLNRFKKTKLFLDHLDTGKSKTIQDNTRKSRKRHYEKFSDAIKHNNKKYKKDHFEDIKKSNEKYYKNHSEEIKKNHDLQERSF